MRLKQSNIALRVDAVCGVYGEMLKRIATLLVIGLAWAAQVSSAEEHAARGLVLKVVPARGEIDVSCDEIPGYMNAMEMSFEVRDRKALSALKPGMAISFSIVTHGKALYAEKIQPGATQNFESEPMEAGSLTALQSIVDRAAVKEEVKVGEAVPDFVLTDQTGKEVHLTQLRGKVVVLTFGYSRCPNPNYCLRLSNNLEHVEKRFHARAGKDLVLLTIAIDPEHDRGTTLTEYAKSFNADPADWHFLTGSLADVKQTSKMFGMNFWSSEGLLTHPLHTVIIDREGRLAMNLEGNQFSAKQLGDLALTEMNRP